MHIDPLPRSHLPQHEPVFAAFEEQMGFVPNNLLVLARRPAIMAAFVGLLRAVWTSGTLDPGLKPLVALMSSYGAGCRYCQAHEASRAHHTGVPLEKIAALGEFDTSEWFTEPERAALRLALAAGQSPNAATGEHFEQLAGFFSPDEIVDIVAVIATFGFLNRFSETIATELEEPPAALAEASLAALGWTAGRHAGSAR